MPSDERAGHASNQIFGLVLLTVAATAAAVVGLILTEGEGTFIPQALIAGVTTWVVWRFDRTWATIVGIVGALATTLGLFFLAFGLFQFFSPLEYVIGLLLVLGFLISLVAGILVLVSRAKDRNETAESGRRFRQAVLGVIGVLAVVSIAGFVTTRSTVSEADAEGAVALEMAKFEFEPESTTVAEGEKLFVTNSDPFAHDFVLEEYDISAYVGPGGEGLVDLSSVPAGTYQYFCSFHTDPATGEGMTGKLIVES